MFYNRLRYDFDGETGNYYLRNRYYSPIERQFLTEDPHGIIPDENWNNPFGITNQYTDGYGLQVYAGFNPVNNRDDWGLKISNKCGCRNGYCYQHVKRVTYRDMTFHSGVTDIEKPGLPDLIINIGKGPGFATNQGWGYAYIMYVATERTCFLHYACSRKNEAKMECREKRVSSIYKDDGYKITTIGDYQNSISFTSIVSRLKANHPNPFKYYKVCFASSDGKFKFEGE